MSKIDEKKRAKHSARYFNREYLTLLWNSGKHYLFILYDYFWEH